MYTINIMLLQYRYCHRWSMRPWSLRCRLGPGKTRTQTPADWGSRTPDHAAEDSEERATEKSVKVVVRTWQMRFSPRPFFSLRRVVAACAIMCPPVSQ